MKNKPNRHKSANTFKFQSFAERIANIEINVFHHVKHKYEEDDQETFFQSTLEKWMVLNLTESFDALRKELPPVSTLPQLLLLNEKINQILISHLKKKDTSSLQPVLELVSALAKDLRREFYPYFTSYLPVLIELLLNKDPDQIEWTFTCLANLFKFLMKYLKDDKRIRIVLKNILPLLSDTKPNYINNFAAESFAFVARKVEKIHFMKLIFGLLNDHPDSVIGCGQLLFEIVKGVAGQFHSCAESVLPVFWNCLVEDSFDQELVHLALEQIINAFLSNIKPNKCEIFWITIMASLEKFILLYEEKQNEKEEKNISFLFEMIIKVVGYRNGQMLSCYKSPMIRFLIKIIDNIRLSQKIILLLINMMSKILLSSNLQISQEEASKITSKVLKLPNTKLVFAFIEQLITYASFETLIQPQLVNFCSMLPLEAKEDLQELFELISKLVVYKAPLLRSTSSLESWQLHPLKIDQNQDFSDHILLNINLEGKSEPDLKLHIFSLLISPHFISLEKHKVMQILRENILLILNENNNILKDNQEDYYLNLLALHLHTMNLIILTNKDLNWNDFFIPINQLIKPLLIYIEEISSKQLITLRILDLYLTGYNFKVGKKYLDQEVKTDLEKVLVRNLSSPFHEIRLMTCKILTLFDSFGNENQDISSNYLKICLKNEKLSVNFENHREIIHNIGELKFDPIASLKDKNHLKGSLYYLFGVLYKNFKPIWEPTLEVIASYAHNMKREEFWPIFLQQLEFTTKRSQIVQQKEELYYNCDGMPECIRPWFENETEDRIDHLHFRQLFWKAMLQFVNICEAKNRDVSTIFITFLEEEYFKYNLESSKTWNVKQYEIDEDQNDEENDAQEDDNNEESQVPQENEEEKNPSNFKHQKKHRKNAKSGNKQINKTKILLAQMELFSKFANPKAVYKEAELNKIYLEFLKNFNPEIQKKALECLFTYKPPYLIPYKEHLFGLLDDNQFKTTIVLFQLDETSELIQEQHRQQLIPLVLRIVYAKMLTRTGSVQSSGKSSSHYRRSLILRFLSGCNTDELRFFVQMSFHLFHERIQDNSQSMVKKMLSELDLERCFPPRLLVSALRLLLILYDQIGHHLGSALIGYTARVVFLISTNVHGLLATRNQPGGLHIGYVNVLKTARTYTLSTLTRLFEMYDRQEWTVDELESLFESSVWTMIDVMGTNQEQRMDTPTALLKLFATWSKNPRYHILLAKRDLSTSSTVISNIIGILNNEHAQSNVMNHVLDMVQNLLTLSSESEEEDIKSEDRLPPAPPLKVLNVDSIDNLNLDSTKLSEPLNIGSKILLPHITTILKCLQRRLTNKSHLSRRDLIILSRISELALILNKSSDEKIEWIETLLKLSLPIAIKQSTGQEDIIHNWIITIENLIQIVPEPDKYLRSIAPFFGRINYTSSRKRLLAMTSTLINLCYPERDSPEQECLQALLDLNSFDTKWIDRPDFNKRLDGFKKVEELLNQKKITLAFGSIYIHQCFFIFHYEKDLALRDSASYTLSTLAPTLTRQLDSAFSREFIISQTILPLVRYGIRSKVENVRDESLALLGEMSRQCSHLHNIFSDLGHLTDARDSEVDFFENLRHLQLHRHGRALLKFVNVTKKKKMHVKTLIHILLPLITNYLLNDKYSHKHTLVNSAIEALEAISHLLPWHQYDTLLRFYLGKLRTSNIEYQKQLTRIIITILDGFHFDLSKAIYGKNMMDDEEEDKKQEEEQSEEKKNDEEILEEMCQDLEQGANNRPEEIENETIKIVKIVKKKLEEQQDAFELNVMEKKSTTGGENEQQVEMKEQHQHVENDQMKNGIVKEEEEENNEQEMEPEEEELGRKAKKARFSEDVGDEQKSLQQGEQNEQNEQKEEETRIVYEIHFTAHAATRVSQIISKKLLPQLNNILVVCSPSDHQHKLNRKITAQDEQDVLRVPIALAVVKLLQKLPKAVLDMHLASVLLRLSNFLKSRLDSVRRATRQVLQLVMQSLGPKYLHIWLNLVQTQFTRGYQCHVLLYTVHGILGAIRDQFQPNDLNESLQNILALCHEEIFGHVAEEKEVVQVAAKVFEARSTRSYDTYQMLAQYITESCFTDLLSQLKDILFSSRSFKIVNKANECLRRIALGLIENEYISTESLLKLTHGLAYANISELQPPEEAAKLTEEQTARQMADSFLIPLEPKTKMGVRNAQVVSASCTNTQYFIEFGLRLLHSLIKRERVASINFRPFLDPFLPVLTDCIDSKHIKLAIMSVQCITYFLKMSDLPSLKEHIDKIAISIFNILHKYAVENLTQGEHSTLVSVSFKALTTLIRSVPWHVINEEQLKAAILYAEQDMYDIHRQSTSFDLLRAIMRRKLKAPELDQVMSKISELSITSTQPNVRLSARQVFSDYMNFYPQGKKIGKHIYFYCCQLEYRLKQGRESALEMLIHMIKTFPSTKKIISRNAEIIFCHAVNCLANDDEPDCRRLAANCIKLLFKRLDKKMQKQIFETYILPSIQSKKVRDRSAGLQVLTQLIVKEEEAGEFEIGFEELAKLILGQFKYEFDTKDYGRFIRHPDLLMRNTSEATIQARDHLFYHAFHLSVKFCSHRPAFLTDTQYTAQLHDLTDFAHRFLSYPHDWCQLGAMQLLGFVFTSINITQVAEYMLEIALEKKPKQETKEEEEEEGSAIPKGIIRPYLLSNNPWERIKSLILDHCEIIDPNSRTELIEQALRNLVYLGRILKHYSILTKGERIETNKSNLSLQWMIRRMKTIINQEVIHRSHSTEMRSAVFKWIGALISDFQPKIEEERLLLERTVPYLMIPLIREMTMTISNAGEKNTPKQRELTNLAKQVAKLFQNKLGQENYSKCLSDLQMRMTAKRAERKKAKKQEAITDPERAAKRKIGKQIKKKEAKKRKLEEFKGKKKSC